MDPATKTLPVPVTIVTGFLGSGKTTLINHVLNEIGSEHKLAIVKNEIGTVAVDGKIIKGENIVVQELLNGCVCCTLVGSLEESLEELVRVVRPERIIIETSGAANPAILAVNIDRMPFVKREIVVTVVDAVSFRGYADKTIVGRLQQKFTDLIVINKVGLVSSEVLDDVLDSIYETCPSTPVVKTSTGRVSPDVLFGVLSGEKRVTFSVGAGGAEPINIDTGYHPDHLHEDEIETFTVSSPAAFRRECVEKILSTLSDEYYRVKGFVRLSGVPGVWLVNYVCGRYSIEPFGDSPAQNAKAQNAKIPTELACIGKKIARYQKKVQDRFMKCEGVT